jgi:hypothetical protein
MQRLLERASWNTFAVMRAVRDFVVAASLPMATSSRRPHNSCRRYTTPRAETAPLSWLVTAINGEEFSPQLGAVIGAIVWPWPCSSRSESSPAPPGRPADAGSPCATSDSSPSPWSPHSSPTDTPPGYSLTPTKTPSPPPSARSPWTRSWSWPPPPCSPSATADRPVRTPHRTAAATPACPTGLQTPWSSRAVEAGSREGALRRLSRLFAAVAGPALRRPRGHPALPWQVGLQVPEFPQRLFGCRARLGGEQVQPPA